MFGLSFKKKQEFPIYKASISPDVDSDLEVNYIGLVDRPAIERNFQAFNAYKQRLHFALNEEKQIISGPAMIADMPIYRQDPKLGEYYVVFDRDSIRAIVEKFSAKGYLKNFNLFHDQQQQVSDVTIFNSFINDKSLGIAPLAGFEDVADGSWFISAKVNNPAVWQSVKSGAIKGFSVEGLFEYMPANHDGMHEMNTFVAALRAKPVTGNKVKALLNAMGPGQEYATAQRIKAILQAEAPDVLRNYPHYFTGVK